MQVSDDKNMLQANIIFIFIEANRNIWFLRLKPGDKWIARS